MRYVSGQRVTARFIENRKERLRAGGWPVSKWLLFCEQMLLEGYAVHAYEARSTRSRYVYVAKNNLVFKVRFSNHPPARFKMQEKDSDFYVGMNYGKTTNTEDAISAVRKFFGECYESPLSCNRLPQGCEAGVPHVPLSLADGAARAPAEGLGHVPEGAMRR